MSHVPSITKVNIHHANSSKTVAFSPGLDPLEIVEILQSVFNISDSILGFLTKVYIFYVDIVFEGLFIIV